MKVIVQKHKIVKKSVFILYLLKTKQNTKGIFHIKSFKIKTLLTENRNCETGVANPAWRYHCRRYEPGVSTSRVPIHESTRLCFMDGLLKSREGFISPQFLEALKHFHRQTYVYTVRNRDNERIFTMYYTLKIASKHLEESDLMIHRRNWQRNMLTWDTPLYIVVHSKADSWNLPA
jgi:hypothetical protein